MAEVASLPVDAPQQATPTHDTKAAAVITVIMPPMPTVAEAAEPEPEPELVDPELVEPATADEATAEPRNLATKSAADNTATTTPPNVSNATSPDASLTPGTDTTDAEPATEPDAPTDAEPATPEPAATEASTEAAEAVAQADTEPSTAEATATADSSTAAEVLASDPEAAADTVVAEPAEAQADTEATAEVIKGDTAAAAAQMDTPTQGDAACHAEGNAAPATATATASVCLDSATHVPAAEEDGSSAAADAAADATTPPHTHPTSHTSAEKDAATAATTDSTDAATTDADLSATVPFSAAVQDADQALGEGAAVQINGADGTPIVIPKIEVPVNEFMNSVAGMVGFSGDRPNARPGSAALPSSRSAPAPHFPTRPHTSHHTSRPKSSSPVRFARRPVTAVERGNETPFVPRNVSYAHGGMRPQTAMASLNRRRRSPEMKRRPLTAVCTAHREFPLRKSGMHRMLSHEAASEKAAQTPAEARILAKLRSPPNTPRDHHHHHHQQQQQHQHQAAYANDQPRTRVQAYVLHVLVSLSR